STNHTEAPMRHVAAALFLVAVLAAAAGSCSDTIAIPSTGDGGEGDGAIGDGPRVDMRMLGCAELSDCLGGCQGDHGCEQDCLTAATARARQLRLECLDCQDRVCPHMGCDGDSGLCDPCYTRNPDYPRSCDECKEASSSNNGVCYPAKMA